jgi:glycosyltransferase involved in cell wall biosynthesis
VYNFNESIKILIPAYKAENELLKTIPSLQKKAPKENIVVVIDGIFDDSEKLCNDFGIKTVIHEKNRGKGAAILSGFRQMSKDVRWVITMDADGQHSPDDLDVFLEKIRTADEKTAIILGARKRSVKTMPLMRIFSNWATSAFISFITKQKILDSQCGYRAYRLPAFFSIKCKFFRFEMESECILRLKSNGFVVDNVPIRTLYNAQTSHISHFIDTFRWVRAMLVTIKEIKRDKR